MRSTTAGTEPGAWAAHSATYSGRMPSSSSPSGSVAAVAPSHSARPARVSVRPSDCTGKKFMPGEPMKWPTKRCAGRSNNAAGEPSCTTLPRVITTTWSAKVSASTWSWVT